MTLSLHDSGGTRSAPRFHVHSAGVTKAASRAWVRDGGLLKLFYAALDIALSTYTALGRGNSATVLPVTSEPVTATVTGAVGTVTHAWTRTAPDAHLWTIDDPTAATTTFTTTCDQGESFEATFIDTVTDQGGQVLASDPVTVNCANIYYGGGYPGIIPGIPGQPYP